MKIIKIKKNNLYNNKCKNKKNNNRRKIKFWLIFNYFLDINNIIIIIKKFKNNYLY
jgi:hypothetical protein